jgi:PAS domain-containing protein
MEFFSLLRVFANPSWSCAQIHGFWTVMAIAGLFVVERRGGSEKLDPKRQVEISTLLESMPEAVFLFGPDRRIIENNAQAERLTGYSREELRGVAEDGWSHGTKHDPLLTEARADADGDRRAGRL